MEVKYGNDHLRNMQQRCIKMKELGWDHHLILPYPQSTNHHTIINWCSEHFEQGTVSWAGQQFWFKNKEDLVYFKLTWL